MTLDHLVALSLLRDLPRLHLTERLSKPDPGLLALAAPLLESARTLRARSAAAGVHFVAWDAPTFPVALLTLPDCPPGLWYQGSLDALNGPCVAVVGSRAASPAGRAVAADLAAGLAAVGVTVVSGLARGVDSAAHEGALRTGRTVAVLGSGHRRLYPKEHDALAAAIAREGAVISEYPPDVPALPFHFPMRNRLISGLSRAVVVIEAAESSGSLITASCAAEQGRDVMVVPGAVAGGRNRGGHKLIRDGAAIVESAADVLAELHLEPVSTLEGDLNHCRSGRSVDPLLAQMAAGALYDLDDLAALAGVSAPRLLGRLSQLELDGLVRRAEGGRFIRAG